MAHPTLLRLGNTLVYIFFLSSSLYDVAGPDSGSIGYGKHQTYLTPAPFAFAIWGLIHFLFFGFVVWQWFAPKEESDEIVVNGYGSWFIIAGLLTSLWHNNWESGHLVISLIILLFASGSVTSIYYQLQSRPAKTPIEHLFVHAPVSLFHGWLVFITWLNIFAIFTKVADPAHPNLLHRILVFLVLLKLAFTAMGYTELKNNAHGDIAGAFAITWALIAVGVGQESKFITISALVLAGWSTVYALKPQVFKKSAITSERQPLLGAPGNVV
ncbi:uncharacterized protein EV422DRAFT_514614 [Fimicolochytrium jonesii]|uniref:uncharacterized protein n=1 Tax=Fimicolochytrium jonesii TaxID=1396493 RepID=UPI0022FE8852|nr:uncharacterized protein EV422DRAFT_514614 [Fimicolochytrium jonesii]KAI8825902.1 hypothetical protein EV422DRAFT_514614 [Fimicolochytrium jonesii]